MSLLLQGAHASPAPANLRDWTPNDLRRVRLTAAHHAARDRILERLLEEPDRTWLSGPQWARLEWGHGLRGRKVQADFDRAAAKVARERRLRLTLATVLTCDAPPGAARRARWEDVCLTRKVWAVPRRHLPNVERKGMRPRERVWKITLAAPAVDVLCKAREVGDGWGLLRRLVRIHSRVLPPDALRSFKPPAQRRPRTGLVFPNAFPAASPEPLPEHTMRRRLRDLIVDSIG